MTNLLIYLGENRKFDVPSTVNTISAMPGVADARTGSFIGAVFECSYSFRGRSTIVRISEDAETVVAVGLGDESLDFALKLQASLAEPLSAVDMDYSFNIQLSQLHSLEAMRKAIEEGAGV